MYVSSLEIENIRSISRLKWQLPPRHKGPGWHVILGENGAGKSSFVQSLALVLVGPDEAPALRQDWNQWLRQGEKEAHIRVTVRGDKHYDWWAGTGRQSQGDLPADLWLKRNGEDKVHLINDQKKDAGAYRHVWSGHQGWFSAAYGPFRRFRGGETDLAILFYANPRLARHLSAFSEGAALTEGLKWLKDLHVRQLEEPDPKIDTFLANLKSLVNETEFLPHQMQLAQIKSSEVIFRDGQGKEVPITDLSDGFRAMLSMTFELLRQMAAVFGPAKIFGEGGRSVKVPGVVMIDEVDAHLHPTWQHRIGQWFKRCFPQVQFLVTTHSPIICQAAEGGTLFRLPAPGSDEQGQMLEGAQRDRLIYGDVLDAYGTHAFGEGVTRSEAAMERIDELAQLNQKELTEAGLTKDEQRRQEELRAALPGMDPKKP